VLLVILLGAVAALNFHIEDEWLSHPSPLNENDPPRPAVPPAFTSSIQLLPVSTWSPGVMYYDLKNRRSNITVVEPTTIGNFSTQFRELALNRSFNIILNDRCQAIPNGTFGDYFSWTQAAADKGQRNLGPRFQNRSCDMWEFVFQQTNLTLCAQGNVPVLLNIIQHDVSQSFSIYFEKDFFPGIPAASLFVQPENCLVPDPLCDGGEAMELDAFIFHPAHMFDLYNENVADLLGDTVFICADSISNHSSVDQFQWVSRYTIQVWSAWGQYAECNRPTPNETGLCIGSETFSVGREAAFAIKEKCGQCADNTDVGSWFSLPTAGMCNSTTQPLGSNATLGQCTWRMLEKKKTIDGKCLLKTNDMLSMCLKELNYPFAKSAAILLQSFESSDPSQGGCVAIA